MSYLITNLNRAPEKYDWCLINYKNEDIYVMVIGLSINEKRFSCAVYGTFKKVVYNVEDVKCNFGKSIDSNGEEVKRRFAQYFV